MVPVTVELDKTRTLRYGLNAMCALEDAGVVMARAEDLARPKTLRAVLWAGLIHEEPTLTVEEVGAMVEIADVQKVATAISKAFAQAQPEASKSKHPRKAQR